MIPIPFNEQFRLAVLENFGVMDTEPEERFDRITRLASRCFDVPIALISLVGAARQWFMSSTGLDVSETPRELSFCGHAIMDKEVFVIPDAARDARFAANPLVTDEPKIRFYAGAPLITDKGFRLGTLCLIDRKPRDEFDALDRAMLSDLSGMVVEEMYRGCEHSAHAGREGQAGGAAEFLTFEQRQAQEAQLRFVASLSHELRTPLNAIVGFSEAMQQQLFGPIDNDRYLDYARHINDSGNHLARFVDSVLDYVKAEKGELNIHEDWVDVAATVQECRSMFVEQIRSADLQFQWSPPNALPLLKADPQLVMQMLVNLIGNCIKFTEAGGTIEVSAGLDPDGGLRLSVVDTGVGIAAPDLQICQLPFGQAKNAMTRNGGTGLGLTLTKQFIELHDGELSIESRPAAGTTVSLHFPAYRVD